MGQKFKGVLVVVFFLGSHWTEIKILARTEISSEAEGSLPTLLAIGRVYSSLFLMEVPVLLQNQLGTALPWRPCSCLCHVATSYQKVAVYVIFGTRVSFCYLNQNQLFSNLMMGIILIVFHLPLTLKGFYRVCAWEDRKLRDSLRMLPTPNMISTNLFYPTLFKINLVLLEAE